MRQWHGYSIWRLSPQLVRRRWPQALIAWMPVLRGRIRDPLVGAHVLIGIAVGVAFAVWHTARLLDPFSNWLPTRRPTGGPRLRSGGGGIHTKRVPLEIELRGCGGTRHHHVVPAVARAPPPTWAAGISLILLLIMLYVLNGMRFWIDAAFILPVSGISLLLLIRFGVLSGTVASFVASTLTQFPLTTHISAGTRGRRCSQ